MSTNISTLLEELYALEPSLREKEPAIIAIIERMQSSRPDVPFDDDFRNELRQRVIRELRLKQTARLFNWKFFLAGFSTVAVASFAVFSLANILNAPSLPTGAPTPQSQKVLSFAPTIQSTAQNAFGSIQLAQSSPAAQIGGGAPAVQPTSRGNMSENPEKVNAQPAPSTKMAATDAMIMPPQNIPYYQYSFTGTLPPFTGTLKVYKKTTVGFDALSTRSLVDAFRLDSFNLSALQNAGLGYATFFEDRDYGYAVNLDFANGSVSVSQNWQKWPQLQCNANGCEQPAKLTEKDIPSDEELIRIANEFLSKYGINTSGYGAPRVDAAPRIMYARAASSGGQEAFLPEQFNVSYPLKLDDKDLYEEYGGYRGITVSVDVRAKRVTGMYGLEKENLLASEYTNQTDAENIAKIIRFGGRYETRPYEGQKTVEVSLTAPTLQYVHVYGEWKDGKADEYYVPAYVFTLPQDENRFGPSAITVPLVKDFALFTPAENGAILAKPLPATMEANALTDPMQ